MKTHLTSLRCVLAIAFLGMLDGVTYATNPSVPTPYISTFTDASGLGAIVTTDEWTNLSSTNHPGYPGIGAAAWPAPIGSDTLSSRLAVLQKAAAGAADTTDFLAASSGGGIYAFMSNTHFEISVGVPQTGVTSIRLELSMSPGATGLDNFGTPSLILSTSSGLVTLSPISSALVGQTPVNIPGFGDTNIDLQSFTWDVSSFAGDINSFVIDWQVDQHSITYGAQVAEGAAAVPEPSAALLLSLAGAVGVVRMRCRVRRLS